MGKSTISMGIPIDSWLNGPFFTKEKVESMDFWLAALLVHAKDAWLVIVGSFLVQDIGALGVSLKGDITNINQEKC